MEREELEKKYGEVWDTGSLGGTFRVHSFCYGMVTVTKKDTGVKGTLDFQHMPRFYFDFRPL